MPLPGQEQVTEKSDQDTFNLDSLDGLEVTDGDIEEALSDEKFESVGVVSMPDDVDYIEFSTEDLAKRLAPFLQKKAISRDIITKSLKVVHSEDSPGTVFMFGTDGTSYLATAISAKVNNFPKEVILDAETLGVILKTHKSKTYLIYRNGKLFSNFYGGEIFIPTYTINSTVFNRAFGDEVSSTPIEGAKLNEALVSLTPILVASEVPDMNYLFAGEDGVYACNGSIVAKVNHEMPDFVIRHVDVKIILPLISATEGEQMYVKVFEKFVSIETDTYSYAFPKINDKLDANYKAMISEPKGKFFVNLPYIASILNVLDRVPEGSGVLELSFADVLNGISKTRKADESTFQISNSKEGQIEEGNIGVANRALQVALRVFKGLSSISISKKNEVLGFSSEGNNSVRSCSIVLKR